VARLRQRVDAAAAAARAAGPPVKALVAVASEPLIVAGAGSHVGDLLRAAGGENLAGDSTQPFPIYSLERMVARAPAVVVLGSHGTAPTPRAPLERLAARLGERAFRIVEIDGDLLFRPGPRVADGVEALARALRPTGDPPVPPPGDRR
jgi:iron complex transport system substrate-binding protein